MSPPTEERLRAALGAYADRIDPDPEAYARARAVWRRRERRRRLLVLLVAAVVIGLADVVGLWVLDRGSSGTPVVFDGPAPARLTRAGEPAPAPPAPPAAAPSAPGTAAGAAAPARPAPAPVAREP